MSERAWSSRCLQPERDPPRPAADIEDSLVERERSWEDLFLRTPESDRRGRAHVVFDRDGILKPPAHEVASHRLLDFRAKTSLISL